MARGIIFFLAALLFSSTANASPPVIAAIAASAIAATTITAAGALAFSWSAFALSLAVSAASSVLAPKPKKAGGGGTYAEIKSSGSTQSFRQPITSREIVYGEVRKGGPIVYVTSTSSNKYLHMFIALASHEVQEIGEIMVDDYSITDDMMDADGNVTSGRYSGYARIRKHLGTTDQTADTKAVAEISDWTTNHRLRGIAYVYVRFQWNRDKFPNGVPNISAWVKGKKVYDPRDASTVWKQNIALFIRDYLSDTSTGLSIAGSYLDDDSIESAANVSDEYVTVSDININITAVDTTNDIITLSGNILKFVTGDKVNLISGSIGGLSTFTDYYVIAYQRNGTPRIKLALSYADCIAGTAINLTSGSSGVLRKIAEPRYHGGGILKTDKEPGDDLSEMFPSMAGALTESGGKWRVYAGAYRTPTVYLDENDLAGGITVSPKISKQDRFNRVQGVYNAYINNGNPSDYPMIKNDTYEEEDLLPLLRTLDLPFTQRPHTAQRIAKAALERSRQEISFTADFKLTAFKVLITDNFYFSFPRYGWSDKIFECVFWRLSVKDSAPVITMTCREMATTVYDWNNDEETAVDPAPNTTLPDPFTVTVVTGFSIDSFLISTQADDKIYSVVASWDAPGNEFVLSGGRFEIEYKETTSESYASIGTVDGSVTTIILPTLKPDVLYDFRIFNYNSLGVKSASADIYNYQVGSTVITNSEDWESVTEVRDGTDWESDTATGEDWE